MRWYLIVILTCISLMIRNVEHFYLYLLVICVSPLDKCLFKSFVHFKLGLLLLRFKSFYVFWILISYQISDFKYFFSFHGLPFCSVNSVFWRIKILNFHAVQFVFFLCCLCLQCHIQEIIAKSNVVQFFTSFTLRVFFF